jgi:hypothetical protein
MMPKGQMFPISSSLLDVVINAFQCLAHIALNLLAALVQEHTIYLTNGAPIEIVDFNLHGL